MNYEDRLYKAAVVGAAGKMGSGILLLTAIEMTDINLKPENRQKAYSIYAIDKSEESLKDLQNYIHVQLTKIAEKRIVKLRETYALKENLIENSQIIDQYVEDVKQTIRYSTKLESAFNCNLVFEAASENIDVKTSILSTIEENSNDTSPFYYTNTSSIPIDFLNKSANLGGRIIGFHFYNPPAIQKLVELITIEDNSHEIKSFAHKLAESLQKVVVPSNDIAGFIGNGHFMRELVYAFNNVDSLFEKMHLHESIYIYDNIIRDYLIRPMGIFQLADYVGLEVVKSILGIMSKFHEGENLKPQLLDKILGMDIKGGQYANGSQKDGFFQYKSGRIVGVLNFKTGGYVPVGDITEKCDTIIGDKPKSILAWKEVIRMKDKAEFLTTYFHDLHRESALGAKLAIEYGKNSLKIGLNLITDNIANNEHDVNTVMLTGFYHAYGPINNYFL
ncbi:MAG: 3-hydroxyacyl-CoA dehydrogenase family protein [Hyphomicrobiales bacterium]